MAIRAHDELAGDRKGTERAARGIGQKRDRARSSVACVKTAGTVAGFAADHRTGNIAGDTDGEKHAVAVRIMTILSTSADQTKRRYAGTGEVGRGIKIGVLARQPVIDHPAMAGGTGADLSGHCLSRRDCRRCGFFIGIAARTLQRDCKDEYQKNDAMPV